MPVWKWPCYIQCSISQTQTCPHFALLFPLNSHQPVQQSLQDVRQCPAKQQEGPGSWAWHQGQPQELNHRQQSLSHLLLGGTLFSPNAILAQWGQIFTASVAYNTSGSGVSVCQTLYRISSVHTHILPFSSSFPLCSLCSLHCSISASIPFLMVVFSATGQARIGRDREGTGTKSKIKPQILFSIL